MTASPTIVCLLAAALCGAAPARAGDASRPPVHPRRNVETFAPVEAQWIRFSFSATTRGEPCLDELELYGPDDPAKNLAHADTGTTVTASGTLPDYRIHALRHLNDGLYGNSHSWIGDTTSGWVTLELPRPARIDRLVWSRDRFGKFIDRLVTVYRIEAAARPGEWTLLSSSDDRRPLETAAGAPSGLYQSSPGFHPGPGENAGPSGPASREYILETWHSGHGLPANGVTAILQDPSGWLWTGTTSGLARFDGVQFSTSGAAALEGLRITCLLAGENGTLWAGTDGGGLFRQENGVFTPVPPEARLPEKSILALARDAAGTVWAGTPGGLYACHNGVFTRALEGPVPRVVRDEGGGLWLLRNGQLARFAGGTVTAPGPAAEPSRFSALAALAAGPGGAVWFGGANEYLASLSGGTVATFAAGHALFTTALREILPAAGGDVWLGTAGSGLARMRRGELLTFGPEDGMPSNSFAALCQDTEGNIWAGGNDGLTRLSPRRCQALTLNDGLSQSVVLSLAGDSSGRLILGTGGGGLNRWQSGRAEPWAPSYVLENEVIPALLATRSGTVWAATLQRGLARLENDHSRFLSTAQGLPENAVTALCMDPAGGLWTGSPGGGPAYVLNDRAVQPPAVHPLRSERITAILAGPRNRVWFATAGGGLAMLDGTVLTRWTTAGGLAGNSVRTLHLDTAGTLWAGTSAGLSRWREGSFESFTARHGLPGSMISQILDDGAGYLWLGTGRGIARVALHSFDAVSTGRSSRLDLLQLDKSDGLPSMECTGPQSAIRRQDGTLAFGTTGGLAIIDPARFAVLPPAPPVFIEPAPAADKPGGAAFHFTALAYSAPHRLRFRYRLDGLETQWTEAATRSAAYGFLPPGTFRFLVEASLDGGPWGSASTSITIPAPWWRSPWATASGIAAGITAVAAAARFFSRRRLKRRLREVEQKLAIERERTRIARDIHDQLGANLTHIALLSAAAPDAAPEAVRQRFLAITASSNELVQAVDAIVWAVNPRHGSLESLARYLSRFAADFLATAPLRLRLDIPVDLPEVELNPEMRHSLFLASREALNNSVRHAGADEILLRLRVAGKTLTVQFIDNGAGFHPSPHRDGDGLENMRRRLSECGGHCEIASAPGRGTAVTFTVPLPLPS